MAADSSEGLPISPSEKSLTSSLASDENEKSASRSPSSFSIREDKWPDLVVSRPRKLDAWWLPRPRDPVIIERSNLVNISKLIVKELIETSLKYGRMLDSDHMPLQHFFIVLEHVLRHGLRPKKGILGPKKELWDILQLVEKYCPEAQDITSSIRDLPTVRTAMGRARAWLRMALMQKKLADYLKVLIDHKEDILSEYFEPDALMMSEEAIVIMGLLVGLNVIDCNLCVKEEDLDCQQGVIDFSIYLRNSNHIPGESPDDELENDNMTTVLDQKNYIEELNRHLNATVTNLQAKVESLTTTNALMKEDLAIAKNNILSLHEENRQLKKELGIEVKDTNESGKPPIKITETTAEIEELRSRLEAEKKMRQDVEKELELQISMKSEMEVAMKLLEKDIHEKQDTIISLRRQLDEIKLINLEMYKKLQECEGSLKHKTELITKLEAKTLSMTETIQKMDEKCKEMDGVRSGAEKRVRILGVEAAEREARVIGVERELRLEREWRTSLQEASICNAEKISQLHQEIDQLRRVSEKYLALQEEHYALKEICSEQERTLEELGGQLSAAKLVAVELREAADNVQQQQQQQDGAATWANDRLVSHCKSCNREFNITRRKIPATEEEWEEISHGFNARWNFPHCIGAMDGKHVEIVAPENSGSLFYNYKRTFSVVLLVVVDSNYNIIYADVGCQGRISDGGVFHHAILSKKLEKKELALPRAVPLMGRTKPTPFVLVADDAFPLSTNLMKAFPGHHDKCSPERIYNYKLCRARRIVENVFGILSSKFRVFLKPIALSPKKDEIVTLTCIYLHNFCVETLLQEIIIHHREHLTGTI